MDDLNRSEVFKMLGVKPRNVRWAWCAVSPDETRAVFTIWSDRMTKGRTKLLPDYGHRQPGASDQRRVAQLVMAKKIESFGLVCEARDIRAEPRSIKSVDSSFLIRLKLRADGKQILGVHEGRVSLAKVAQTPTKKSGVDDLDSTNFGSDSPDRAKRSASYVVRDEKVRKAVLRLASGKCEYCKKKGFKTVSGRRYLEAHHVIALANEGRDRVTNVIALCPNHHRQAHYGENGDALEKEFIKMIKDRRR